MLKVENLDVCYGDLPVLWDVSLVVEQGDIVALVGPNGAGKTTTLKTIAGLLKPSRGQVTFCGQRIDQISAHQIVDLGLSLVPEWKGVFASLSVLENLELGAFPAKARPSKKDTLERVFEIFPILAQRQAQKAGTLSGGERQMLAIAATNMETMIGPVSFNPDGTGKVSSPILQYQNGKVELVWPKEFATADFVYPAPPFGER